MKVIIHEAKEGGFGLKSLLFQVVPLKEILSEICYTIDFLHKSKRRTPPRL
jgi:hypothetical protein